MAHKQNGTWRIRVDFKVDSFKQKNFTALIDHQQPYEFKTNVKGYAMETVIHIDYQLLQYFQSYTKLQKYHYSWMGFLQQIHLVIKDKEGLTSKVVDMLSLNASVVLHKISLVHESYVEQYRTDDDFKDAYESLSHDAHIERVQVIQEVHISRIAGYFSVRRTMT